MFCLLYHVQMANIPSKGKQDALTALQDTSVLQKLSQL